MAVSTPSWVCSQCRPRAQGHIPEAAPGDLSHDPWHSHERNFLDQGLAKGMLRRPGRYRALGAERQRRVTVCMRQMSP